jgi:hypothetical protein
MTTSQQTANLEAQVSSVTGREEQEEQQQLENATMIIYVRN